MAYSEVIPRKLKGARAETDLTQEDVANVIGKNKATVVNWEKGANMPPFDLACELADLYGVTLDRLAGRDERRAD